MNISLIQTSIEWMDPLSNMRSAEGWIQRCEGSSLCILPEMFSTGFCMDSRLCTESCAKTLEWMRQMAQRYQITIGGGVAVEQGGEHYNRFYVVRPNGEVNHYDKRHLFSFAGEQDNYSAGGERIVIEIEGVRILLQICYDLRFPVWGRNRGDYDVVIYIAAWAKSRRRVWDTLLRARAIENVAYVCGVNIVGDDPTCEYSGGTAAIDFRGEVIAYVEDDKVGVTNFEVDMEALRGFRKRFPALDDGDDFEID